MIHQLVYSLSIFSFNTAGCWWIFSTFYVPFRVKHASGYLVTLVHDGLVAVVSYATGKEVQAMKAVVSKEADSWWPASSVVPDQVWGELHFPRCTGVLSESGNDTWRFSELMCDNNELKQNINKITQINEQNTERNKEKKGAEPKPGCWFLLFESLDIGWQLMRTSEHLSWEAKH